MRFFYTKHFLLFLLFVLTGLRQAAAYQVVTIGTASGTASILGPTTSTLSGARTERHTVIYTVSELNAAGLTSGNPLFSIAWDKTGAGAYAGNDLTIRVWLKHSNVTSFSSNPSFATETASATLVYETTTGTIPAAIGYVRFVFNQASFSWNGTDNLQVITEIIRPGSYANTTFSWRTIAASTNAAANSNGAAAVDAMTRTTSRPLVQFEVATSGNDGALISMPTPVSGIAGSQNITVVLRNTGTNTLTSANISYTINGGTATVYSWTGSLQTGASTTITIGTSNFTNDYYTIIATITETNGAADNYAANNAVSTSFQICSPLTGPYTINSAVATGGTNFNSFSAFAASLTSCGVSGPVTATVMAEPGPYKEQVTFQNITGIGAGAPIIINGNGATISAVTTATNRHVIRLTDMQYFTIDGLKVQMEAGSAGGFMGIHLMNSASNVIVKNCEVDITGSTSTLFGSIILSGSTTSILAAGNYQNVTISDNKTTGGGYGVSVYGLTSPLSSNVVISNNTIYDAEDNGVYIRETDGVIISGNTINRRTGTAGSANGIQLAQSANINGRIFNNYIRMSQTNGALVGIYLFAGTGHKVYNNVIHEIASTSGNVTAIQVRTGASAPDIYFNTISIDNASSTTGNLYGIREELSNTNSFIRNNIISISQPTTGIKAGIVLASSSTVTTAVNSNYNIFWIPGGNVAMRNTATPTYYATLTAWNSASNQDANSWGTEDPRFVSSIMPKPTNAAIDNAGTPIAGVTTDILGVTRGTPPDAGAYEFVPGIVYTFIGSGNWDVASNWSNNQIPPSPLPSGSEVIINPSTGGCILNVPFVVGTGGKLTVLSGKNFIVQGNIVIQ